MYGEVETVSHTQICRYKFLSHNCANTHTSTYVFGLNVCSCGRRWLILSNSMATLHLPTGSLVFNYHQLYLLLLRNMLLASTDKLMEHLITVNSFCSVWRMFIRMSKHSFISSVAHLMQNKNDLNASNRIKTFDEDFWLPCWGWHGSVECCSAEKYIKAGTMWKGSLLAPTVDWAVSIL